MTINWVQLYQKHRGNWVALQDDEVTVIASGSTAKETLAKAAEKGYQKPILAQMPKDLSIFVG